MRIPLSVRRLYLERKGISATWFVHIPSMRVARPAAGWVDTGSPYTAIAPRDALAFQLPFKNWQKGETVYLAGFRFYSHPLEATLIFKDTEFHLVRMRQQVKVLVPTKMDETTLTEMQAIPSLIGTDLLEDQGLKLVFDAHASIAYFERNDSPPVPAVNQSGTISKTNP